MTANGRGVQLEGMEHYPPFNLYRGIRMTDDFDSFVDDLLENGEQKPLPTKKFLAGLEKNLEEQPHYSRVLLSTTASCPGHQIVQSKGIVTGRVVKGQGPWKNFKMAFGTDAWGGRSETMEKEFLAMEQECFRQLKAAAFQKGANGVVGVSLQFGETSGEANLFFAIATGTAVVIE